MKSRNIGTTPTYLLKDTHSYGHICIFIGMLRILSFR